MFQERYFLFIIVNFLVYGFLQIWIDSGYYFIISFIMVDIYNNRVSYLYDGSEIQIDSFVFIVIDGIIKMFFMQRDGRRGDISVFLSNFQVFIYLLCLIK